MKNHWKDRLEGNIEDRGGVHVLRLEVYRKDKEELIKRDFLMEVPHPKGAKIDWYRVDDNVIQENEENKEMGICVFDYKLFEKKDVQNS